MAEIFNSIPDWKDVFMKEKQIYPALGHFKEIQNHEWIENEEFSLPIEYKTQGLTFYTQPRLAKPKQGATVYPVTRAIYIRPATLVRVKVIFSAPRVVDSKNWYEYYTFVEFIQEYVCFFVTPYPHTLEYDSLFFDEESEIIGFACRLHNVEFSKE